MSDANPSTRRSWQTSLTHSFRAAARVERTFADPWAIARATLGVIAATVIGRLFHDPLAWAMMTVGTFICGIATLLAPTRHRAVNAAVVGVAFSLATLMGAYVHQTGWYFLIILFAASYLAGLWRALGAAPGIRACLVVIGLMITADLTPAVHAGLTMVQWIAVGCGITFAVQLLPPYGRRHPAQRKAIAALYQSLSGYARAATGSATGTAATAQLPSAPFTAARSALGLLPEFARPAAAPLFALLSEAEGLRRALLSTAGAPDLPREAVAELLSALGRTVLTARRQTVGEETVRALDAWRGGTAEAVLPRLREAQRLADLWLEERSHQPERLASVLAEFPAEHPARTALRRLRAELRPGAPLFMHAIRIAVGTTAAEAAGRGLGDFWGEALPDHGFWAALTAMLVLFPDYGHTFARGWARPVGSIVGGLAAWALLLPDIWSPDRLVVAATVLAFVVFLTLRTSQWVLNIFITAWIVFLISRLGATPHLIAWGRPADTIVGSVIALIVFLALPTYHHHRLPGLLAEWIEAMRPVLTGLLTGYVEAGAVDPGELDVLRNRSRAARERLDAAIGSLAHEPHRHHSRWSAEQLTAIHHSVFELTRTAALLYDRLPGREEDTAPETAELTPLIDRYLSSLADTVAAGAPLHPGTLRSAFDHTASRSGLADLTDPTAPDGLSHPRARALTTTLQTVTSLESLTESLTDAEL